MKSYNNQNIIGITSIFIAAILWGTTGTAATFAPQLSPLAIGAVAMGVGGILQGLIAFKQIRLEYSHIIMHWQFLLVGSISVAIYPLAFYSSMHLSGVAIGTVISIGTAPLFCALIEYYLDGATLTRKWFLGTIIGITGMALLSFAENNIIGDRTIFGILLGIIAGFSYALYSWSARRLMQKKIIPQAAMGVTFGCGGLLLIPILLLTGSPLLQSWTNATVGIYMAIIPMFIGYICYGIGLAKVKSSTATTITLVEPVIAAILAVLLVGEQLPLQGWLGIILIVICLFIITLPSHTTANNQYN